MKIEPFDHHPYLLLCEGIGDQRFFRRLFDQRQIGADFTVRFPIINGEYTGGGRSQFGRYLSSLSVDEAFSSNVKAVLIVSDNDEDPKNSFAEVQAELKTTKLFAVPDRERKVASGAGSPDVVVLMLPIGADGNLESLCLPAAYSRWPIEAQLDDFVGKVPAGKWTKGKQAKMRLQTILAAHNDAQPDAGFGASWNQAAKYRIPVEHACFNDVAQFIADFPKMILAK